MSIVWANRRGVGPQMQSEIVIRILRRPAANLGCLAKVASPAAAWYTNPRMLRIAVLASALGGVAFAQPATQRRLEIPVDTTLETDVGYMRGFLCDDQEVVRAELRSKSETSNVFVVTGLKLGATQCRVGTDLGRPSILFEVRIIPRKVRAR
jgi:hypothetical protein